MIALNDDVNCMLLSVVVAVVVIVDDVVGGGVGVVAGLRFKSRSKQFVVRPRESFFRC